MKIKSTLPPWLALVAGLFIASAVFAADAPVGELIPPTDKDAAWLTGARAAYPIKTCVVSEEELGGMGDPVEYIYRQAGHPDQLVRFCCKMCVSKFKKDPAKYLAQLSPAQQPEAPKPH